jgi:hypothetical protein
MARATRGCILAGALVAGWCAKGAIRADFTATGTATGTAAGAGAASDDLSSQVVGDGPQILRFDTFGRSSSEPTLSI